MTIRMFVTAGLIATLGLSIPGKRSFSQPVRSRILDDVSVNFDRGCGIIRTLFTFPVQYIAHVPAEYGVVLFIKLRPIAISREDGPASRQREALRPPAHPRVPLDEVTYEGEIPDGPFLRLQFNRPVTFKVAQGADFRSIDVFVTDRNANEKNPCGP